MRSSTQLATLAVVTLFAVASPVKLMPVSLLPAVAQTTQDRRAEAIKLNNEGQQLRQRGEFRAALIKYEQALIIVREIGERQGEGVILNNIGFIYDSLGQYRWSSINKP